MKPESPPPAPAAHAPAAPDAPPDLAGDAGLLALLLRTTGEGVLVLDRAGRVTACNDAAQRMLAPGAGELRQRCLTAGPWQALREDGSPLPDEEHPALRAIDSGASQRDAIIGLRQADETRWLRVNADPLRDAAGGVHGVLVSCADISAIRRRELQLAETEARWRMALDAASHGVWEWDVAGDRCRLSPRSARLFGLDAERTDFRPEEWEARIHPADRAAVQAARRACLAGEHAVYHADFRVPDPEGGFREIVARGRVVAWGPTGRPLRMLGTHTDVTEARRAEAALLESERRFFQIADASPMPVWVAGVHGERTYLNRAWLARTGRTLAGSLGKGWRDAIVAEDLAAFDRASAPAIAERRPFSVEYRLRHADGSCRRMFDEASPRFDGKGNFLGYAGLCVDIESHYAAEREIAKLSRAVDQAALSIVITDAAGNIEYANPHTCSTYGYRLDELLGRNPSLFKSERTGRETYAELWATLARGETWTGTLCNRRRDGSDIWEAVTISPVRDESGATTHYVALKEDITARVEASRREFELQDRMHRMERLQALGTLAAGVAHDFNNILVAILGFSELGEAQLRAGQSPQRVAGYLAEIRSAGERARALVRQLLAVGRSGPIALADVDLATLARDAIELVATSMPQQTVTITAAEGLPSVHADPTQLHQVLVNLLLNARDAMQPGGTARVAIDTVDLAEEATCAACGERFFGAHLQLAVSDDGCGIPEPVRERIFESFFTTKDVDQGTGMGLAVVEGIVHRHGGHLLVDSPPTGGARFRVLLPLAVALPDDTPS